MDLHFYKHFREIPPGIGTSESWRLRRCKVIPRSQPVAFFRPDDFVPERFGYQEGIPLYRRDQTKRYSPKPPTVAGEHYYDYFVASQNRFRYGEWDVGKRPQKDVTPTWRNYDKYLSRAKIRNHLSGKDIHGCWGNLWTNWFCVEPDYHGGDPGLFLDTLPILEEFTSFFPNVRWFYGLNRNGISGLHLVGLLPEARLLEEIRQDVQKALGYLEDENIKNLLKYKPADVTDDQFHPVANLEIYPVTNHNFRLPYARDRITVTDEWLNLPGQVDLKPNLVKFMDYVEDKKRQAVAMEEIIDFIKANIQWKPPKQSRGNRKRTRTGGGNGMGKIQPLKGRHLEFITGVVLGKETMPNDTIGCWAVPALRHLMLVDGLGADEALGKIEEFYDMIPETGFSDRLTGNVRELLRTDGYTVNKIEAGNLYQPGPEESTEKFAGVKARCQQIGFVFADPSTWHVLGRQKSVSVDVSDMDFSLTFEEKLAVKEPGAAMLKCDVPSVYQAAHRIKAFVTKYPGKELPAILVPVLCAGLPINWFVASDHGTRCKKAERFLGLVCSLGIIKKIQEKQWFGLNHPRNKAAMYGLPKDADCQEVGRYSGWGEGERESIYYTDSSAFSEDVIEPFVLEIERLNRPWKPQYHSSG